MSKNVWLYALMVGFYAAAKKHEHFKFNVHFCSLFHRGALDSFVNPLVGITYNLCTHFLELIKEWSLYR